METVTIAELNNSQALSEGDYIPVSQEIGTRKADIGKVKAFIEKGAMESLAEIREKDIESLNEKLLKHDMKISSLEGLGRYLEAKDFEAEEPGEEELTEYALERLNLEDAEDIPNGIKVKNLFDGNVWVLFNDPLAEPPVFVWVNNGSESVGIATDTTAGTVKSSAEDGKVEVDPVTGVMTAVGLAELRVKLEEAWTMLEELEAKSGDGLVEHRETFDHPDGSVDANKLADGAITTAKLGDRAVTLAKLALPNVPSRALIAGAAGPNGIAAAAWSLITSDCIGSNAITSAKLESDAVTTAKINNAAVTYDKLASTVKVVRQTASPPVGSTLIYVKSIQAAQPLTGTYTGFFIGSTSTSDQEFTGTGSTLTAASKIRFFVNLTTPTLAINQYGVFVGNRTA